MKTKHSAFFTVWNIFYTEREARHISRTFTSLVISNAILSSETFI